MTTFKTDHGTVRYSGRRRFIVVSQGRTVKRTDSIETAKKAQADWRWHGATIVDTTQRADERTCRICQHEVLSGDFEDFGAHWNCMTQTEREAATVAWRAANKKESN